MNRKEITNKLEEVLEEYGLERKQLSANASFTNDLGLDSLDFAELILKTEQIFDTSISFEHDNIDTINDLINIVENQVNTISATIQKQ